MHNRPDVRCFFGLGLGALLMLATGCAPAAGAAPPVSPVVRGSVSSGAAPEALASNVVVDDPNKVPVSSAIRKVTVYSDRALVSRQGAVKIASTPTVYAFRQLPGWVDEGSVRAAGKPLHFDKPLCASLDGFTLHAAFMPLRAPAASTPGRGKRSSRTSFGRPSRKSA